MMLKRQHEHVEVIVFPRHPDPESPVKVCQSSAHIPLVSIPSAWVAILCQKIDGTRYVIDSLNLCDPCKTILELETKA